MDWHILILAAMAFSALGYALGYADGSRIHEKDKG
jgi:hypothetical protein